MSFHLGRILGPFAKHLRNARGVARIISPSPRHGLKLILNSRSEPRLESQPDVYPFAAYLAERFDCTNVIVVGKPTAKELIQLFTKFEVIGIVPGADLDWCRKRYAFASWLEADMDRLDGAISQDFLEQALIVCKDLDKFANPAAVLSRVKAWLESAPVCVLTSAATGAEQLLRAQGVNLEFMGLTASDNVSNEKKTALAVLTKKTATLEALRVTPPPTFRVVAFMAAYNEQDIIVQSIKKWTDQGVRVHVLENWSTDGTYELAKELEGRLPVVVERFPKEGPTEFFDWGAILERIETLAQEIDADWFVRRGADEILVSPWPGINYRDALYLVDQQGFNCVDHTIVEFHPVDDGFAAGMDHEVYFKHFDLKHLSHPKQRKAWKNCRLPISTVPSAGHDIEFDGRRIYPFKFLLKHYSFRSQTQGQRKVFRERKARWNPKERGRGWHVHYDSMQEGHQFVQRPSEKEVFDEARFNETYFVERLSGIGTDRG